MSLGSLDTRLQHSVKVRSGRRAHSACSDETDLERAGGEAIPDDEAYRRIPAPSLHTSHTSVHQARHQDARTTDRSVVQALGPANAAQNGEALRLDDQRYARSGRDVQAPEPDTGTRPDRHQPCREAFGRLFAMRLVDLRAASGGVERAEREELRGDVHGLHAPEDRALSQEGNQPRCSLKTPRQPTTGTKQKRRTSNDQSQKARKTHHRPENVGGDRIFQCHRLLLRSRHATIVELSTKREKRGKEGIEGAKGEIAGSVGMEVGEIARI